MTTTTTRLTGERIADIQRHAVTVRELNVREYGHVSWESKAICDLLAHLDAVVAERVASDEQVIACAVSIFPTCRTAEYFERSLRAALVDLRSTSGEAGPPR